MPSTAHKIILFDIDGTVLTCNGAGQLAMETALADAFHIQPPFKNIPCAGRTDRGIGSSVFDMFQLEDCEENRNRFRDAYLHHLPECLAQCKARLLPGILELLDTIECHPEIQISLLTGNYESAAKIKLKHFGLQERFRGGVFGDTHAERDRLATDAVELFSKAHGVPLQGEHFLVIGDTPADVQCARAIEASAIAVATGIHDESTLKEAKPDVLLTDLSDTTKAMNAIKDLLTS